MVTILVLFVIMMEPDLVLDLLLEGKSNVSGTYEINHQSFLSGHPIIMVLQLLKIIITLNHKSSLRLIF